MSLTIRAVTGTVVLPSGTNVTSGEVIFKLYGTPPADSDQMATQGTIRMAITNGAISGNIIAPANYHITIISSDGSFYAFSAAVNESSPSDPLTLQAIYQASETADATVVYGLSWLGAWSAATAYVVDDAVSYGGSSYICTEAHTNKVPPNASYWDVLASKGDTGVVGSWQGAWDSGTTYEVTDLVSHEGASYICTAESTNNEPPNASYWDVVAAKGDTGATGATGPTGSQGPPGPAGLTWEGAWDSGTTYSVNDAVTHGGTSYMCTAESTNNEPPNASYWDVLASKGDQGDKGDKGDKGDTGNTGATGATPQVYALDEPGALVDGTLCTWIAAAGSITAAAASVGTAASGLMTLTLQVDGVNTVVLSWAEAELDATASGVPAALTGGETLTAVLATSAGGADLTANFRGVLS